MKLFILGAFIVVMSPFMAWGDYYHGSEHRYAPYYYQYHNHAYFYRNFDYEDHFPNKYNWSFHRWFYHYYPQDKSRQIDSYNYHYHEGS